MIREIIHVNINVTDIERSMAFYEKLGFQVMHIFGKRGPKGFEEAMSFEGGLVRGAVMSLGDHPRAATKIELLEWLEPPTSSAPDRSAHQAGVARIALRVKNLRDFKETLSAQGVEFEGELREIDVVGAQRFLLFRDPDGTLPRPAGG